MPELTTIDIGILCMISFMAGLFVGLYTMSGVYDE